MNKIIFVSIIALFFVIPGSTGMADGNAQSPSITPIRLGNGAINHLAWSPDGQYLAIASSYGAWIYDNDLNNPEQIWHETTETLEWTPDSKTLQLSVKRYVDGIAEKELLLADIETQTSPEIEEQPPIDWSLHHLCRRGYGDRHPTENKLVCVTRNDIVQLWDNEGQLLNELHTYMDNVGQMTWGRNHYELVVYDRNKTRTQVWDVRTGELVMGAAEFLDDEIALAWYPGSPNLQSNTKTYIAWTNDSSRFVTITEDGTIVISDRAEVPLEVTANWLSWSHSGNFLAIFDWRDLSIWDVEAQEVALYREQTILAAWHPTDDTVAITSADGLAILDIINGTTQSLALPDDISVGRYPHQIIWLSNGNAILLDMTINGFGKQAIWDLESGEIIKVLEEDLTLVAAYDDWIAGVLYCCRDTHGSTSTEIVIRNAFGDTITHQIDLGEFTGTLSSVQDLQWNPDGEYLAALVNHTDIYVFEHHEQ